MMENSEPCFFCMVEGCGNNDRVERMLKCATAECKETYCVRCFEQLSPEAGKEDHDFFYLCEGPGCDDKGCVAEAIWECQEENIVYCDECFKLDHKGKRRSHSKVKVIRKKLKYEDREISVFDMKIVQELKHELIIADEDNKWVRIIPENWLVFKDQAEDEYCPVISFIGSTGCGKSFLVQSFTGEEDGPRVAPTGQKASTSANIHLYNAPGYDTPDFSFNKLVLLDCEGDSGTIPEMLQSRWLPLQKVTKKLKTGLLPMTANRSHIVKEEFPRLAYLISDVIVFLETVDFTRIQDYLSKFQKFIESTQKGVFSADTPSLLIVQNKVDPVAVNNRLSVSEATEDFMNTAFPFARQKKDKKRRKKESGHRRRRSVARSKSAYVLRGNESATEHLSESEPEVTTPNEQPNSARDTTKQEEKPRKRNSQEDRSKIETEGSGRTTRTEKSSNVPQEKSTQRTTTSSTTTTSTSVENNNQEKQRSVKLDQSQVVTKVKQNEKKTPTTDEKPKNLKEGSKIKESPQKDIQSTKQKIKPVTSISNSNSHIPKVPSTNGKNGKGTKGEVSNPACTKSKPTKEPGIESEEVKSKFSLTSRKSGTCSPTSSLNHVEPLTGKNNHSEHSTSGNFSGTLSSPPQSPSQGGPRERSSTLTSTKPGNRSKNRKDRRLSMEESPGAVGAKITRKERLENMKERLREKGEGFRDQLWEKGGDILNRIKIAREKQLFRKSSKENFDGSGEMDSEDLQFQDLIREDTQRRRDFEASFDMISCVRIPNYRFVGSIEPNLKAFRDEVKKMVNHQHKKRMKKGTNYSEKFWLDIVQEVVNSCTSLADGNEIRMAQIVGRVLQPHSGRNLANDLYMFFDLLYDSKTKERYLLCRNIAFDFLAILVATDHLRKTGTAVGKEAITENHPVRIMCDQIFDECEKLISGQKPCDYTYKRMRCSQLMKDHGVLHRFPNSLRKKKGELIFSDEPVASRRETFLNQVKDYLTAFHKNVGLSIQYRWEIIAKLNLVGLREKSNRRVSPKCLLCLSNSSDSLLACRHSFCSQCVEDVLNHYSQGVCCPFCEMTFDPIRDNYIIPGLAGYRILCLDGGGTRGIIELTVLKRLMERFPNIELSQMFDLIMGTSTGAILAVALGLKKNSIYDMLEMYRKFPKQIFKKKVAFKFLAVKYAYLLFGGKYIYNIADLENTIKAHIGTQADFVDTMIDSKVPKVAVITTNYSQGMKEQIFGNFMLPTNNRDKQSGDSNEEVTVQCEVKLYQAITASAAAPVYFAPYRIDNNDYVDGALIANNPTEVAYRNAQLLWKDKKLDYIVSVGTGKPPSEQVKNDFISWTTALVDKATDAEVIHKREKARFKQQEEEVGTPKYFRFNPSNIGLELDATSSSELEMMVNVTDEYMSQPKTQKKLDALCSTIIAKAFYITAEPEVKPSNEPPLALVSFTIASRLPEMGEAIVLNIVPSSKSTHPVDKTYEEHLPNGERKISFHCKYGSKYLIHVKIVINPKDPPLDISNSPLPIHIPTEQNLKKEKKKTSLKRGPHSKKALLTKSTA